MAPCQREGPVEYR